MHEAAESPKRQLAPSNPPNTVSTQQGKQSVLPLLESPPERCLLRGHRGEGEEAERDAPRGRVSRGARAPPSACATCGHVCDRDQHRSMKTPASPHRARHTCRQEAGPRRTMAENAHGQRADPSPGRASEDAGSGARPHRSGIHRNAAGAPLSGDTPATFSLFLKTEGTAGLQVPSGEQTRGRVAWPPPAGARSPLSALARNALSSASFCRLLGSPLLLPRASS